MKLRDTEIYDQQLLAIGFEDIENKDDSEGCSPVDLVEMKTFFRSGN